MSNQPDMGTIMEALAAFDIEDLGVDITDDTVTLTGKGANAEVVQQAYDKLQEMYENEPYNLSCEITYDDEEEYEEEEHEEEENAVRVDIDALMEALAHLDAEEVRVDVADDNSITITGRATAEIIGEIGEIANSFENVAAVNNDMEFIEE